MGQLSAELDNAKAQILRLSQQQEALRTAAQAEIAASEARCAQLVADLAKKNTGSDKFDIVDFKAIQPGPFKGRREESWKLWS